MCFFENVEGHISLGLREVVGELEQMGYKVSWGIFSAREVGAPHQRKRVFIMAYLKCAGLEGLYHWNSPSEQTQLVGADSGASCQRSAWPSRPGEAQHGWEPPRVVANSVIVGRGRGGHADEGGLRGEIQTTGSCGSRGEKVLGNSSTEGLHRWGAAIEMDRESRGAESEGSESAPSVAFASYAHGGEVVGNAAEQGCQRGGRPNDPRGTIDRPTESNGGCAYGTMEQSERQTEPSMGGDVDGPSDRLDYAELCVSCDNRTDELRLLGNGVVPATAERAFRTLLNELNT
jgi:DNA (cytosine-5)-methyltransferase 1